MIPRASFLLCCIPALAAGAGTAPADKEIEQLVKSLQGLVEASRQSQEGSAKLEAAAKTALATVSLRQATFKQVQRLGETGLLYQSQQIRSALQERLAELGSLPTYEGAQAAAIRLLAFPAADAGSKAAYWAGCASAYQALLAHPKLGDLLKKESLEAYAVFACVENLPPAVLKSSGLLPALLPALEKPLMPSIALASRKVFDRSMLPETGVDAFTRERIRTLVYARTREAYNYMEQRGPESTQALQTMGKLQDTLDLLGGAWAKGTLMGQPSPALDLLWCSDGTTKRIQDLKGKVVVVDFWATWCGPCVKSFPNLRKLQERYAGYPVVILGLTSPQGVHVDRKSGRKIETDGNPSKEIGLMPGYMLDMRINWTVAFSKQEVFNKDFGISGIPHVAILDAEGKVRFNNLRPYNPPHEEAEKIDRLLREAGLPCPPTPMEAGNFAEN